MSQDLRKRSPTVEVAAAGTDATLDKLAELTCLAGCSAALSAASEAWTASTICEIIVGAINGATFDALAKAEGEIDEEFSGAGSEAS